MARSGAGQLERAYCTRTLVIKRLNKFYVHLSRIKCNIIRVYIYFGKSETVPEHAGIKGVAGHILGPIRRPKFKKAKQPRELRISAKSSMIYRRL